MDCCLLQISEINDEASFLFFLISFVFNHGGIELRQFFMNFNKASQLWPYFLYICVKATRI